MISLRNERRQRQCRSLSGCRTMTAGLSTLETERLVLEPWEERHRDAWRRLCRDPDVMRFIGAGDPWQAGKADFDRALEHWRQHGFGWRGAIDKATGEWLGFAGLNYVGPGTAAKRHFRSSARCPIRELDRHAGRNSSSRVRKGRGRGGKSSDLSTRGRKPRGSWKLDIRASRFLNAGSACIHGCSERQVRWLLASPRKHVPEARVLG